MHWLAARLVAHGLSADLEARLTTILRAHLSADHLATEAAYFHTTPHYERPYGWAWLAKLAAEVSASDVPAIGSSPRGSCPSSTCSRTSSPAGSTVPPTPSGTACTRTRPSGCCSCSRPHGRSGATSLAATVERAAREWFGEDAGWPFAWERSGHDFLSAGLAEADLMRAVLTPAEFATWSDGFFAQVRSGDAILQSTVVRDEADPQQVHLFGLDLSRAGSARRIADALRAGELDDDGLASLLDEAADRLLASGLAASVGEEYHSTHWLASFAWDAMEAREHAAR